MQPDGESQEMLVDIFDIGPFYFQDDDLQQLGLRLRRLAQRDDRQLPGSARDPLVLLKLQPELRHRSSGKDTFYQPLVKFLKGSLYINHNKVALIAQWIMFLLRTKQPQVRISAEVFPHYCQVMWRL